MARRTQDDAYLNVARLAGFITLTLLIAGTAAADVLGRLLYDPSFHVSEVIFASMLTAWTALLGIESISALRTLRNGKSHDREDDDDASRP